MSDSRVDLARELFARVIELNRAERRAFVARECGGDARLLADVESLLLQYERLGSFLEQPALEEFRAHLGEHPRFARGERVAGFEIESFLARGGSGEVYRARQLSLGGRSVALKVVAPGPLSESDRNRFIREARIASTLHHPNLVAVYDSGEDRERDVLFYAMRMVEGPTLADVLTHFLRHGPPLGADRRRVVERCHEVAQALAVLHQRGFVHRDVKPQNVVLEGGALDSVLERPAVLVDFGLVRPFAATTTRSVAWATPSYAAPEQIIGTPVDARADVYSLGLTMHDLLAARHPRDRRRPVTEGVEPLSAIVPDIDRDLDAIVRLATDPEKRWRYGDASALARDLERWLRREPVAARSLRGLERVQRWVQRHPTKVLRAVLAAIVAALAIALMSAGVVRITQIYSASTMARESWRRGDLAAARQSLAAIPALLDELLLSEPLASLASRLRQLEGEDAIVQTLRVLEREGSGAARLLAARHLVRDGLVHDPDLARFLLWSLEQRSGLEDSLEVVSLVSRVFFDRPDSSPPDVVASDSSRRHLVEQLGAEPTRRRCLDIVTALSGCGTHDTIAPVLDWVEWHAEQLTPWCREATRLGLRSVEAIVRRSHACGYLARLTDPILVHMLESACRAVATLESKLGDPNGLLAEPLADLFRAAAFVSRASGRQPALVTFPSHPGLDGCVQSARADPVLIDDLRRAPARVIHPKFWPDYGFLRQLGCLVGSYGATELESEFEARVVSLLGAGREDRETAQRCYREGIDLAREEFHGVRSPFIPDPATRLDAFFAAKAAPLEIPTTRNEVSDADISWVFKAEGIRVDGRNAGVSAFCASFHRAENDPRYGYLLLELPGVSEVRFSFRIPSGMDPRKTTLDAALHLQRNNRQLLPFLGTAEVQIFFDSAPVLSHVVTDSDSSPSVSFQILRPQEVEPMEHVLTVRLAIASNTTLRLKHLSIR